MICTITGVTSFQVYILCYRRQRTFEDRMEAGMMMVVNKWVN